MTTGTVQVAPGAAFTAVGLAVAAGTVIANQSSTAVVWLADSPAVSPGNGIPVQPLGTVSWAQDAPCYAVCDTGVKAPVQLLVTDTVSSVTDPVSLAVAVAAKLLAQQQPVAVQNSPTVQLAAGTEVDLTAGTEVVLANGSTVSLAAGTAVDLAAPVTLASGSQVAVNGGTLTGITNAIPVQAHGVTVTNTPTVAVGSGTLTGITNAIPVQAHAVTVSSGTITGITNAIPVQSHPVTLSGQSVGITGTPTIAGITSTVNVSGVTKAELISGRVLLGKLTLTLGTAAGASGNAVGTYTGLTQYASIHVTLNSTNQDAKNDTDYLSANVAFNDSSGGSAFYDAYWYLTQYSQETDYLEAPTYADSATVTVAYSQSASRSSTRSVTAYVWASYRGLPKVQYGNGGGFGQAGPTWSQYADTTTHFDWPVHTNQLAKLTVTKRSGSAAGHINLSMQNQGQDMVLDSLVITAADPTFTRYQLEVIPGRYPLKITTALSVAASVDLAFTYEDY